MTALKPRSIAFFVLTALMMQFVGGQPAKAAAPDQLRVLSFNIHHSRGADGKLNVPAIAQIINASDCDLVALQEVDRNVTRSGGVDQAAKIAKLCEMHVAFGRSINLQGGQYGNAVLSRWPIKKHVVHPLPGAGGEKRTVLFTSIETKRFGAIEFASTHFDHKDAAVRLRSANHVVKLVQKINTEVSKRTVIIAGDFNCQTDSAPMKQLTRLLKPSSIEAVPTIPVDNPTRQIDHVLYRTSLPFRPNETRSMDVRDASDHRALRVTFDFHRP